MAALTLTSADAGYNSGSWTFAGGGPGADTITNAELLKGLATDSRVYAILSASYTTQAALDQALASSGLLMSSNGGSLLRLVTAGPGAPTATITTAASTGSLRIAFAYSASK